MNVLKQTEIKHPVYTAKLENEIVINVYGDYAVGTDGKTYYHVGQENGDVLETVGWCCDITAAVLL